MQTNKTYYLLFALVFLCTFNTRAQEFRFVRYIVQGDTTKADSYVKLRRAKSLTLIKDETKASFFAKGYMEYSLDSLQQQQDSLSMFIFTGPVYRWSELLLDSTASAFEGEFGEWMENRNQTISASAVDALHGQILRYYEENGYPFVQSRFVNLRMDSSGITAQLQVDKGPLIRYDTLIVEGDLKVSANYMQKVSGIYPGGFWQESVFSLLSSNMNNVEFISLLESPLVSFYGEYASVKIKVKPRKSNTLDAIFGFYTDPLDGSLKLNGNINLRLLNALGQGEEFKFNWQRPLSGDQMLDIYLDLPYISKSSWGIQNTFNLFRRDSSFMNVENQAALTYRISHNYYLALLGNLYSSQSTLLRSDSAIRDVSSQSFGLGFFIDSRDYKVNPRKGIFVKASVKGGQRKQMAEDENEADLNVFKAESQLEFSAFIGLHKRHVMMFRSRDAFLLSQNLSINELYRIGGLKSFRGFDEQSISTSAYLINTLEYRFLLGRNSFVSAFFDHGLVDENVNNPLIFTPYFGYGLGATLDTGAGILSFYLALGKKNNQQILLRNTKVHFGYLIRF
jgi:outer membrane protein assembly factor BamA